MEGSVVCAARKPQQRGAVRRPLPSALSGGDVAARARCVEDALEADLVGGRAHRQVALVRAAADIAVAAPEDLLELADLAPLAYVTGQRVGVDSSVVTDRAVGVGDGDQAAAELLEQPGRPGADVAEPLHDDARRLRLEAELLCRLPVQVHEPAT